MFKRVRSGRGTRTRAIIGSLLFISLAATLAPTRAEAADPPAMFECTGDVHATPQEQEDFASRWSARLRGQDPNFDLQAYVESAANGDPPPDDILQEVGFTKRDPNDPADDTDTTLTRGCLVSRLYDQLKIDDPTLGKDTSQNPPVEFAPETVKSMLAMIVFHNDPETTQDPAPLLPQIDLPDPVTDALNALGLNQLLDVTVPAIAVPANLAIPSPVSVLISDLVKLLQGVGLPPLPDLGNLIQLPALPLELPTLPNLPSLTDLINLIRSVIDATTYTVCYTGDKTNGEKCTTSPLGLPVLLDVQGDALPDLRAHLLPTVVPAYPTGLSMQFSVDRMGLNPLNPPPPVQADVTAAWDLPAANARAHIGFLSRFKPGLTLSRRSVLTATVKNLNDASQGNPSIPFSITHQAPSTDTQVVAGISKLIRDSGSGAVTVPESTIANLEFSPVPPTTTGTLTVQTTNAGPNQVRYLANMNTSIPTKLTMNLLRDYTAADPTAPCCPLQRFTAVADLLPTALTLDILKNDATNTWTVGYTGNSTVGRLAVEGADYPTADSYTAPVDEQTVSSFSAAVTQVPTKVDVVAAMPADGANPRVVDVVYKGSDAANPNAIVTVPTVDLGTLARVDGDVQRSFAGHAQDVPGRIHVNVKLEGDALNEPAGDNLDVDLLYDSSSVANNLTVDFFDKGDTSTSKLSGSIATLPPWLSVNVGNHPLSNSVIFNSKTDAAAPDGSAALGTVNLKYAKNTDFLVLGASQPTTEQYAVVKTSDGTDGVQDTDDDTTAVEAQYTGLEFTNVSIADDGVEDGDLDVNAKVVNDANRAMTARLESPETIVDATVLNVPQDVDVTYQRRRLATVDPDCNEPQHSHKVVYDALSTIDRASVRIQGKANGLPDPDDLVIVNAGRDPDTNGEPIPTHMELFANGHSQEITYRANGTIGQIAASILDASPSCGTKSGVNVDLRGVPTQFGASLNPEHMRFADLASTTTPIDQVLLDSTKPVAVPLRSVAVGFTDHPTGSVPVLPSANQLSVLSDKRDDPATEAAESSIAASVKLAGVKLFKLDLNHLDPSNPETKVVGVVADLQLASTLTDVDTNLDFIDEQGEEARVLGAIDKLTPNLHLELVLRDKDTQVHYETPGGHIDTHLEIGLGTFGKLDTVSMPANRPIGVMIRDTADPCQCAKKVAILMLGAPTTLDLLVDHITTDFRADGEQNFVKFTDYAPPGGSANLSVDVAMTNDKDPEKNLIVKVVLHGVTTGYGVTVAPIAKGSDDESPDAPTYFDLLVKGTKAIGAVNVEVGAGVPDTKDGSVPCSACKLHLTGTISNLPPGLQFHLDGGPSDTNAGRKVTNIELRQLGADGNLDLTRTINSVNLGVLMWQFEPGTQTPRTEPQVQANLMQVPSHITIELLDQGPKDDSFATPCQSPPDALPMIFYTAEGANQDSLDANATIDFVMLSDDPKNVDGDQPVLELGVTDLSHSVKFENTADGKFIISAPDGSAAPTGKVHLEVSAQTLNILNWSLLPSEQGGCGFSKTFGPLTISSEGGIAFNLRTGMVLDLVGLRNITLDPGIIINVDGDFDDFTFGLRSPKLADLYVSGIGIRIKVRISDSIQPSIPLVFPPISLGPLPPFPIDIQLMDLSLNDYGDWIDVNLLVPCDIDVSWDEVDIDSFHAVVRANPGLFAPFTNGFRTADNAKMLVLPFAEQLTTGLRLVLDPIAVGVAKLGGYDSAGFDAGIECPD